MSQSPAQSALLAMQVAQNSYNGGLVTFTVPNVGSVNVTATFGKSRLEIDNGAGGRIEVLSEDFIVVLTDLEINNAVIVPSEGNQVVVGSKTYEVMTPPFSPADNSNVRVRIHTKQVGG